MLFGLRQLQADLCLGHLQLHISVVMNVSICFICFKQPIVQSNQIVFSPFVFSSEFFIYGITLEMRIAGLTLGCGRVSGLTRQCVDWLKMLQRDGCSLCISTEDSLCVLRWCKGDVKTHRTLMRCRMEGTGMNSPHVQLGENILSLTVYLWYGIFSFQIYRHIQE